MAIFCSPSSWILTKKIYTLQKKIWRIAAQFFQITRPFLSENKQLCYYSVKTTLVHQSVPEIYRTKMKKYLLPHYMSYCCTMTFFYKIHHSNKQVLWLNLFIFIVAELPSNSMSLFSWILDPQKTEKYIK